MASVEKTQKCSRCGNISDTFVAIEPGMRVALQEAGEANLPDQVCASCFGTLNGSVSQGLKLRMERDTREKNKMLVWKNRVHLIKNARVMMNQKSYSEAAVQYEKYIRVLEVVYNLKKGELSPAVFNNSARSKELTVLASVYWDLVRIYDTSPRYGDRMSHATVKLAQFLQFSPMYPDIMKKAEQFAKTCRNPNVMRQFLKSTRASRGPCFIATSAFANTPHAVELLILRRFRDQILRPHRAGRNLIWIYYRLSPPVAQWIGASPRKSRCARWFLTKFAARISKNLNST